MGDFEHEHSTHGTKCSGEELGAVNDKSGLEEVDGGHADIEGTGLREELHEGGKDGDVGVEFDLARHIEDDEVLLSQGVEGLCQPVEVLHEELEAVDETAIGPEAHLFHGILEGDEFLDVEVGRVFEGLGGGIEVDVEGRAAVELQVGNEGGTEG